MDPATRVQLAGLLYTVVLPVGAAVAVLALGRRLRPADAQPALVAFALIAGLFAAHAGIGGAPTLSLATADGWLLYGPLIGGLAGLVLDRFAPGRGLALAAVALAVTAFVVSRLAGALAALWTGGAAEPLATAFIADAALAGALVWFALDGAARASDRPAPVVFGPLALALALAALATALSGSARMGQTMGAVAAVTGVVGLAGWRWPALRPGHGAVAVAALALVAGLVHAHHFVELPRAVAGLLLIAPLGALAGARVRGRAGVFAACGLTLVVAGAAAGITVAREQAKAAAEEAGGGEADDGEYYPY